MAINLTTEPPTKYHVISAENSVEIPTNPTGLSGQNMALIPYIKRDQRPLSTRWMSDKLIAETQRVWSAYLTRPVDEAEAIEMLTNVRHLALALMTDDEIDNEAQGEIYVSPLPPTKEHRDLGSRLLP